MDGLRHATRAAALAARAAAWLRDAKATHTAAGRCPEEAIHSVPRHGGAICGLRTSRAAGRFGMLAFRSSGHGGEDHGLPCRCVVAGGWVRRRVYRPRRGPAAWLRLP